MERVGNGCELPNPSKLAKLRAQAEEFDYAGIVKQKVGHIMEIEVTTGYAIIFGLHKEKAIASCRNVMSSGTEWPAHTHNDWEMFIVYRGTLLLCVEGEDPVAITATKEAPGVTVVPKGKKHWATAPNGDVHFYAITYPAAPGFPEGVT